MLIFLNLPARIVRLFDSNYSSSEVAAGVCLGMFMGFIPLNGPMAILLFLCFFLFKINRLSAMLVLPFFKLIYFMGFYRFADIIGGIVLINADFLAGFWRIVTHFPVLSLLSINNTLVAGGLTISFVLLLPLYFGAKKFIDFSRERFFSRVKGSKFIIWFKKLPLINKILPILDHIRRSV